MKIKKIIKEFARQIKKIKKGTSNKRKKKLDNIKKR